MNYTVEKMDYETKRLEVKTPVGVYDFKMIGNNVTDSYNLIAAVALLSELGLDMNAIQQSIEKLKVTESRYNSEMVGGKELIMNLAKGQNPIACSRVCDFIRHEEGTKTVVCMIDDFYDAKETSENMAWIFDIDFEFLNHDSVKQIVLSGVRHQDFHLRLLMAGIPEDRIVCCEREVDAAEYVDLTVSDKIYLLYDVYTVDYAQKVLADLKKKLEKGGKEA